jgi:hypothetical protein
MDGGGGGRDLAGAQAGDGAAAGFGSDLLGRGQV